MSSALRRRSWSASRTVSRSCGPSGTGGGAAEQRPDAVADELLEDPQGAGRARTVCRRPGKTTSRRSGRSGASGGTDHDRRALHVMHLVSNVRAQLAEGKDCSGGCGPPSSRDAAGAPKVRAMEIIDELEPDQRQPYHGGAVGYLQLPRATWTSAYAIPDDGGSAGDKLLDPGRRGLVRADLDLPPSTRKRSTRPPG